jgi:hypothetical protein
MPAKPARHGSSLPGPSAQAASPASARMVPGAAVPPEQERPSPAAAAAGNALAAAATAAVAGNNALLQANGGNADDAEPAIQNNVIISTALNTNFTRRLDRQRP